MGSRRLKGRTMARMMVVGTIRMPTAMQLGLAMVRAASIPMWNLLPLNFLFSSSLTASANGIRPKRNGWDYKNDPDRVEDSRNLHRTKFNWEDAKQRTRKGTLQNALWQGMEQLRQMRADPCFAPDAWVTTWDSHNPGVLALVRKRGEETLVGLFNFTEYPAGASLDALGGEYHTPEGTSVWLADVELEPYQALLVKNK